MHAILCSLVFVLITTPTPLRKFPPSLRLRGWCRSALTSQWLFQLYLALECDVWIGTRNSNWNRLIDEMRCGAGCRVACRNARMRAEFAPCPSREGAHVSACCPQA